MIAHADTPSPPSRIPKPATPGARIAHGSRSSNGEALIVFEDGTAFELVFYGESRVWRALPPLPKSLQNPPRYAPHTDDADARALELDAALGWAEGAEADEAHRLAEHGEAA